MKSKFFIAFVFVTFLNKAQIINAFAGKNTSGFSGNGGNALLAELFLPMSGKADIYGNVYIVERGNNMVRKVDPSGIITTIAGTLSAGFSGDGGPAVSAELSSPEDIAFDTIGNLYIADRLNNRIRKVDTSGIITTFAGTGSPGFSGDGGSAISAMLNGPSGVAFDTAGNLYIADRSNCLIRKVNTVGVISTVAGSISFPGYGGDGGLATIAQLNYPRRVFIDAFGNIIISDSDNNRIRKVNSVSGIITTIVGNGNSWYSGDGGAAVLAEINSPRGLALDASGNLYFADRFNNVIRVVNTSGIINTFAGTGASGSTGDGGIATAATLANPSGVWVNSLGNVFIADEMNSRTRVICPSLCVTGMNNINNSSNDYIIFPNPTSNTLHLETENEYLEHSEIEISNSLGQTVLKQPFSKDIDVSQLSPGLYHIQVSGTKSLHCKFLKE
jgi:sugar lactone lactonase YvrE